MMASMSVRWASEKLSADAGTAAPNMASANSAGASRRSEGIGKSSYPEQVSKKRPGGPKRGVVTSRWQILSEDVVLVARRFRRHDVVGLDPSGRADGESGFRARGKLAGGLVVA